ncbi:uncharacterized protein LOC132744726 [Ruditapes philippinarum]|uniref:uncharacterized protein LOC132744726 n=1 Tax=Ruditapes philippinarum TaxID=129788 RepID=UPI00295B50DD|nr:uncharacterized protein LOC132744726 [Ruditapes philippinarum]
MGSVGGWFTQLAVMLMCSPVCLGVYLITDYYMDDGWPSAFGQVCGKSVEDDCAYINSHLNSLGILHYGSDISCMVQLNAGKRRGARYKLQFKWFDLECTEDCTADSLTIYDARMSNISKATPIGPFCGDIDPYMDTEYNMTEYPTQQYLTLKFKTDSGTGKKGFRILATRTLPYPCSDDYFHCKAENRCIDGRLKCDGTPQCDDHTDEEGCSFWEKLLGGFLALGVSGIVGVTFLVVFLCTGICITVCACTCCKKQCQCLYKCCKSVKPGGNKVGVAEDDGTRMSGVKSSGSGVTNNADVKPTNNAPGDIPLGTKVLVGVPRAKQPPAPNTSLQSGGHLTSTPGSVSQTNVAEGNVTKVD